MKKQNLAYLGFFLVVSLFASIPGAMAQSAQFNSTFATLENNNLEFPNTMSAFFPLFFIIGIVLLMIGSFQYRYESFAIFFSLTASIFSVVVSMMFLAPITFVFDSSETVIHVSQTGSNVTSSLTKSIENITVIPNNQGFRLAISLIFTVLIFLNGLFTILILTLFKDDKQKRF